MKICFITLEYPHAKTGSSGGIGTSIFNLSKGLLKLGHEVIVIIYGQDKDEIFIDNGITFYKVKNILFKGLSFFLTQKKVQKLVNTLYKENKIDIVEAPDWTGFTAFIKLKCPLIIRLNGSDTYFCHLDNRSVKWNNKFLEKKALKNADGIISVSQFTGELTNTLFNLKLDFTVIHNAIDTLRFEEINAKKETQTILYFGTLIRKKGLLELPLIFNEVHKKNPNTKLILVGTDASDIISGTSSTWQMMQNLFDKSALQQVHYLGSVPYSEIKQKIAIATLCVFPTFAEALPVSWIEAMAMQKPIVASNVGWAKEIIDDGLNGFLVHPKNHSEYAAKVDLILNDKKLQLQLGVEARKKVVANFDIAVIAEKSIQFYNKFL